MALALLKSPVLQRLLFENLRRPATIRRTLNQVYIDQTNVDDWLVESIRRPSSTQGPSACSAPCSTFPAVSPWMNCSLNSPAPLLLLWGIRDPWINAAGSSLQLQRHAPAATTEVVLEAGHCPHDEVPDQVNAALVSWLQSLEASPVSTNRRGAFPVNFWPVLWLPVR